MQNKSMFTNSLNIHIESSICTFEAFNRWLLRSIQINIHEQTYQKNISPHPHKIKTRI